MAYFSDSNGCTGYSTNDISVVRNPSSSIGMTTWKHCERMVAKLLGGVRTGNNGDSRRDVEHPHWSIEVKHRQKLPNWIHNAMGQAEREADGRVPIVVLHEKNLKYEESYVIMRLHTFNTETNYIDVEEMPKGPEITNGDD